MARSMFNTWLTDSEGDLVPNGTLKVYEDDGTTDLAAPIYAAAVGGSPLGTTTLTANSLGYVEAYTDAPQPIVFQPTGGQKVQSGFWDRDPVTLTGVQTLTNKTLPGAVLTDAEIENVIIAGLVKRRETGPMIFDVEAYADPEDLNADGTFKINVDATYAINAATDAIRDVNTTAKIYGDALEYGWAYNYILRFNSKVYSCHYTINGTGLQSTLICGQYPGAQITIYSTDSWAGAYPGTPGYGVLSASQCPQWDGTKSGNCTFLGIGLNAMKLVDGTAAPTSAPGLSWLFASTEIYKTADSRWTGDPLSATGGAGANSNNHTFVSCSGVGFNTYCDWSFINSVIHKLSRCGGQNFRNEDQAFSFHAGRRILDANGDPAAASTAIAATAFDSPYYPNDATPVDGQERLCRNPIGVGNITVDNSEFHDMSPNMYQTATQSAKKRTMLLDTTIGMTFLMCPISCSGVNGHFEFWGQVKSTTMDGVEVYDKAAPFGDGYSGRANNFIYVREATLSLPVYGLRVHGLQGAGAPKNGWIGCSPSAGSNEPAFVELHWIENIMGTYNGTRPPFFKTLASYTSGGAAAVKVNLASSTIDLQASGYEFGGSIGETVTLWNPGASEQYSSADGGTNRAKRYYADGSVRMYGPLTLDGDLLARHLRGSGTAIAASDLVNATTNWGVASANAATAIRGTDTALAFRITAGNSGGGPGANPTVALTFKSAFAVAPVAIVTVMRNSGGATAAPLYWAETTSGVSITYLGTPANGDTFDFKVHVLGAT